MNQQLCPTCDLNMPGGVHSRTCTNKDAVARPAPDPDIPGGFETPYQEGPTMEDIDTSNSVLAGGLVVGGTIITAAENMHIQGLMFQFTDGYGNPMGPAIQLVLEDEQWPKIRSIINQSIDGARKLTLKKRKGRGST